MAPRRPTLLESPPPGVRCPACWQPHESPPNKVSVCARCFALLVCLIPGRLQRLAPADVTGLPSDTRLALFAHRARLVSDAADRWRAPRPQPPR